MCLFLFGSVRVESTSLHLIWVYFIYYVSSQSPYSPFLLDCSPSLHSLRVLSFLSCSFDASLGLGPSFFVLYSDAHCCFDASLLERVS